MLPMSRPVRSMMPETDEVLDVSEVTDDDDTCDFCLSSMDEHEDYVRGVAG
jgi:hypothetical protein